MDAFFSVLLQPSVREMSNLLQQKGRLESELEAMKRENTELSDKAMGLEILVSFHTCTMVGGQVNRNDCIFL